MISTMESRSAFNVVVTIGSDRRMLMLSLALELKTRKDVDDDVCGYVSVAVVGVGGVGVVCSSVCWLR